jgi:hypothetical protein
MKFTDSLHVDSDLAFLYLVDIGSVAGVSEANAASVFMVEVACTSEPLATRLTISPCRSRRAQSTSKMTTRERLK